MTKIKELPINDRPIERLLNCGVENLNNEELISILLKTGNKGENVKELSLKILKEVENINELKDISIQNLIKIKGIGIKKAATLISAIELGSRINKKIDNINSLKITNSKLVYDYFKNIIGEKKQEYFYCLYLDNSKKVIKNKMLFLGTINYSTVHPREIFKEAYIIGATSIICIHNHPSGNITPSNNDIELTDSLIKIGNLLGIKIDDHIIISNNNYFSFFENKLM